MVNRSLKTLKIRMEEHLWWPPTDPLFGHSAPEHEKHDAGDANGQILLSPENNNNEREKKKRKKNPSKEKEKIFRKKLLPESYF